MQMLIDADELLAKFRKTKIDEVFPEWKELGVVTKTAVIRLTTKYRAFILSANPVDAVPVPCKIGDEVWGLKKCRYRTSPAKGVVHHMYFGEDMRVCICVRNVCRGEWGKNVFATKEEAESALAKMNGGNEDA